MQRETPRLSLDQTNTISELEASLDQRLEELKARLQTETDQFLRQKLQELEQSVQESNERAKKALQENLKKASGIRNTHMQALQIDSVNKQYQGAVELGLKLLQQFQEQNVV